MRPVAHLADKEARDAWGNADLDILLDHFSEEKEHTWTASKETFSKKSPPVVEREATLREWKELKETVCAQGYPVQKFNLLWIMINKFHKESFPNLLKLAGIALAMPVHTVDVERGFSTQNNILTKRRNSLSFDTQNQLMKQKIEGEKKRSDIYIKRIIDLWGHQKRRKIFRTKKD